MGERKLPYAQSYKTVEEVKKELRMWRHPVPPDEDWEKEEVITGIGIYNTKTGILARWLIDSDGLGGR